MIVLKILAVVVFGIPVAIFCLLTAFSSILYASVSTLYKFLQHLLAENPKLEPAPQK